MSSADEDDVTHPWQFWLSTLPSWSDNNFSNTNVGRLLDGIHNRVGDVVSTQQFTDSVHCNISTIAQDLSIGQTWGNTNDSDPIAGHFRSKRCQHGDTIIIRRFPSDIAMSRTATNNNVFSPSDMAWTANFVPQ